MPLEVSSPLVNDVNVDSGCEGAGLRRTSLAADHEDVDDIGEVTDTNGELTKK